VDDGGSRFFPKFGNLSAKLHVVASRKAVNLMLTIVRTSNITTVCQTFETTSSSWVGNQEKYHSAMEIIPDVAAQ
jgi:hypothetical protein